MRGEGVGGGGVGGEPGGAEVAVERGDGIGRGLDTDGGEGGTEVVELGGDADDRGGGAAQRVTDAGHAEDDADGEHRVAGREEDEVGLTDRLEHAGGRGGAVQYFCAMAQVTDTAPFSSCPM